MSLFNNPEIKKRWQHVLKKSPQIILQGRIIVNQGETFPDSYLIVEGSAELYRELSSKKLGAVGHITFLGPYDIISINGTQEAKYTVKVKSHQIKLIRLTEQQKQLVSIKAVNEWRKAKAQILQRKYNNQQTSKRPQQKQRSPLLRFINNGQTQSNSRKQKSNKSVAKLPTLYHSSTARSNRSISVIKDRRTPICQDPEKLFSSVLKDYLSKRIDYETNNIPLTICTSIEMTRRDNKQNN